MALTDSLIGKKLGDYVIQEKLGKGGMSDIYLGEDEKLQRRAAIKVMSTDSMDIYQARERFEREARSVGMLEHDSIIPIYQFGVVDDIYFIAMRYIEGNDLADEIHQYKLRNELMPVERLLGILEQVASALDRAHQRGVIHRDVKPSNILLQQRFDNTYKAILTDFGLVLLENDGTMGTAFGTPRYISPEQATDSQSAVNQSDIYSLAVIVYEILTGELLFKGYTPMEVALSHIIESPTPPRAHNPDIPIDAQREILKALQKAPEKRHTTAKNFIDSLKEAYNLQEIGTILPLPVASKPVRDVMPSVKNTDSSPNNHKLQISELKKSSEKQTNQASSIQVPIENASKLSSKSKRNFWSRLNQAYKVLFDIEEDVNIDNILSKHSNSTSTMSDASQANLANRIQAVKLRYDSSKSIRIFLSYSSKNRDIVIALRHQLESMGHEVWMDDKLSVGTTWWEEIINQVENCDVMLVALSSTYLQSTACQKEYTHALKWKKHVLPVQIQELNYYILPRRLAQIQTVPLIKNPEKALSEIAIVLDEHTIVANPPTFIPTHPNAPMSELNRMAELAVQAFELTLSEEKEFFEAMERNLSKSEQEQDAVIELIKIRLSTLEHISDTLKNDLVDLLEKRMQ